jgi:hypothetical protein
MNEIKLAILRDMGLNNNGYADKTTTVTNVHNAVNGSTLGGVLKEFKSLVEYGHLKLLGGVEGREFYCLPENYRAVMDMFVEMAERIKRLAPAP